MLVFIALVIQKIILTLSYPGIFLLMAADALNIPTASELTMSFAGFLAQRGDFLFLAVIIVGSLGNIIGASVNWFLGRKGRDIFISRKEIMHGEKALTRWGMPALFIGNLLPVVRSFIAFPAGLLRIPYWKFLTAIIPAQLIWNISFALLGYKLGQNWQSIEPIFHKFEYAIIAFIILGVMCFIWKRFLKKQHI